MMMPARSKSVLLLSCLLVFFTEAAAQTTTFTYQGKLTDGGNPANGSYDLQLRLFDAPIGGAQVGTTLVLEDVNVANGVFSATPDFGAAPFPGANRFMEISVRHGASVGAFTALSPLQPITSTPYAIRSIGAGSADGLSAVCSGCVSNVKLGDGSVTDAKVSDVAGNKITGTIPVGGIPSGSPSYIQNGAIQQASAGFNVSGSGVLGGSLIAAGSVTANAFNYASPQTSYYFVNEAAFTARDGTPVSKGSGSGGAYPNTNTTSGLVAPINLPDGATVTSIQYVYVDNSAADNMFLRINTHFPTAGTYSFYGEHTSSANTTAVQVVDVPVNFTVNNSNTSFEVFAHVASGWSNFTYMIRAVRLTYTMPRPAR